MPRCCLENRQYPTNLRASSDGPVPMSLDRDASDRTFDRQLAYLGLLDDATPLFRDGSAPMTVLACRTIGVRFMFKE